MRRWRRMMRRGRALFLRILRVNDSSSRLALGAAVGMFVAMTPTIGLQMGLVLLLLLIIPGNKAAGLPMVWVTNPATAIPIYTFNYWLGAVITGQSQLRDIAAQWRSVIEHSPPLGLLFSDPGQWYAAFGSWLAMLWSATEEVLLPLWVGSLVVALVCAVITYFVMYYLIEFYRRKLRLLKEHLTRHVKLRRRSHDPADTSAPEDPR